MYNLTHLNTMALRSFAPHMAEPACESELQNLLRERDQSTPLFVLSGGSNVLLPSKLNAQVVRPKLRGIRKLKEDADHVYIEAMAGENWHEFVVHCVNNGWYGLENLALIPGWVGAAPVQNIGAYGVEINQRFFELTAYHIATGERRVFDHDDCRFGYRDSIFKKTPNTWLISKVIFKLYKEPRLVLNYGDVSKQAGQNPTAKSVVRAIINIRQSKLPDPKTVPNCGSFFQNPVVEVAFAEQLLRRYPTMPHYPQTCPKTGENNGKVKLAAGWLIDQAGLKGFSRDGIGTHEKQALVLVNHAAGASTRKDVARFSDYIQKKVLSDFGVKLQREPVWVDF